MKSNSKGYTVLARKYRPQTFSEVVGQQHVTQTLQNAIKQKRVGQGYLFIGTRGVGKTTIARILSKALNCLSSDEPVTEPCCTCENCQSISAGSFLDVIEIDGASNRGIEEIRRLRDSVAIAPVSGRFKIYIIDEVHMLTREAFNALLKTLEEPPPHVKFFFATTEPHKIPATILSRVQKFELKRINWSTLYNYVEKIAESENVNIDKAAITVVAKAGSGSVRDAMSVLDQVIALADDEISEKVVVGLLGWSQQDVFVNLNNAIISQDIEKALEVVRRVIEKGSDPEQFILGMLQFLRNVMVVKSVKTPKTLIEESPEFIEILKETAGNYSLEQLIYSIDILMELIPRLEATEAKQTALELAVMKLLYARRQVSVDDIFSRLELLENGSVINEQEIKVKEQRLEVGKKKTEDGGQNVAQASRLEESTEQKLEPEPPKDLDELWKEFLKNLENNDHKLFSILNQGNAVIQGQDSVQLVYKPVDEMCYEAVSSDKVSSEVKKKFLDSFNKNMNLSAVLEKQEVEVSEVSTIGDSQSSNEKIVEKIKNNDGVKSALELFPGSKFEGVEE